MVIILLLLDLILVTKSSAIYDLKFQGGVWLPQAAGASLAAFQEAARG